MIGNHYRLQASFDPAALMQLAEGFQRSAARYGGDLLKGGKAAASAAAMKRRRDYFAVLQRGYEASLAAQASRSRGSRTGGR